MSANEQLDPQTQAEIDSIPQYELDFLRSTHSFVLGVAEDHPAVSEEALLPIWRMIKPMREVGRTSPQS